MSAVRVAERPEVSWPVRLENWAAWVDAPLGTGVSTSRAAPTATARAAPYELDAQRVEALLVRLKRNREPLYDAVWQRYVMRERNDVMASDALRCSVQTYLDRLEAAYRALALYERTD